MNGDCGMLEEAIRPPQMTHHQPVSPDQSSGHQQKVVRGGPEVVLACVLGRMQQRLIVAGPIAAPTTSSGGDQVALAEWEPDEQDRQKGAELSGHGARTGFQVGWSL